MCVSSPSYPARNAHATYCHLWPAPLYRVRHKSVNTPFSDERLVGGLQDGGRGTHVTHFVQLYPQPLYTASQVRTTCRSWDEGVLTDVCLTGVLTDLCLTLYNILPYYPINGTILERGKKLLNTKCVFWFSLQLLVAMFPILRRIERDVVINVHGCSRKVQVITVKILMTLEFYRKISLTFHRAFFEFTEWQTPANSLHIQQYISLECRFQC